MGSTYFMIMFMMMVITITSMFMGMFVGMMFMGMGMVFMMVVMSLIPGLNAEVRMWARQSTADTQNQQKNNLKLQGAEIIIEFNLAMDVSSQSDQHEAGAAESKLR